MFVYMVVMAGVFGLIVGSFLNVVVLRHNTGRSLAGRSGCLSCSAPLSYYMLVPVLSWVLQRRMCASCGSRISVQYPIVELTTGLLFAAIVAAQLPLLTTIVSLGIAALFVCIAAYDIKHTIIPDRWAYAAAALALVLRGGAALQTEFPGTDLFITLLAGPLVALPLFVLWFATRGRGIGLGDAKLGLAVGWLLGVGQGLMAVMLSFVIGALVSIVVLLPLPYYRRWLVHCGLLRTVGSAAFTMKSEVPFGPFLIAGAILVWFSLMFGIEIPILEWWDFG